jgi:rhamnosyltransferase
MIIFNVVVLLAAYNGSKWLQEQIDSILNQINVNVTVFISIDESADDTLEMCMLLSKQYNNIIILPSIGRIGSAAKNFFRLIRDVDINNFDYVALADQDDIWNKDKLLKAVNQLQINSLDAYSSNVTAFWPDGKQCLINKAQSQVKYDYMFESAGPGCTFVLTKNFAVDLKNFVINKQNYMDNIALHDWFIYALARSKNYKWYIDTKPSMLYRQHNNNVIGANVGIKSAMIRWGKIRQGWLIDQALLIAEVIKYPDNESMIWLERFTLPDRFKLIINARLFRRRLRDQFVIALFFILHKKQSATTKN